MRSLIQFLSDLRTLGVLLSLDRDRLICNAPKGVVTPEIRKELADRKPEVIAFLRQFEPPAASSGMGSALRALPLSRAQQRLWFLAQLYPQSPAYNMVMGMRLTGNLNQEAMESSLHALVDRHESLRTAFYEEDGTPLAQIIDGAAWKMSVVDLTSLPREESEREARLLAEEEARKPFALEYAPLFRATLFRHSSQHHFLLLIVHHIVGDGWSLGVLAKELGACYSAFASRRRPALADIVFQYRDYVHWERDAGERSAAKELSFWLDRLKGPLPVLPLNGEQPRPAIQTFRGKRTAVGIEPPLAGQIRELCRVTGTTPYMLLLAAFKALLARHTGVEDIVVGSGTSNRQRQEFAPLVGFFVNNLVMRTDLSGNPTFRDLLIRVKDTAVAAYAHQEMPFDLLVEKLQPERVLSHNPLLQVIFTFQNVPMDSIDLPGLKVDPEQVDPGIARADLSIEVWPDGEGFRCDFEYSSDLFDESTIRGMQADYLSFLNQAVAQPSLPIASVPLAFCEERRQGVLEKMETLSQAEHPLSRSQRRLWFLDQLDPGRSVYNITVSLAIDGPLGREVLEQSLKALVDRHESLRTRFEQRAGVPYAVVEDMPDWGMDVVDISAVPWGMQETKVKTLAQEEYGKPFSLEEQSLFRATLIKKSDDDHVLVLVMHHIISDGWSLGILAQELAVIYQAVDKGNEKPLPPLRFQFRDYVAWEQQELDKLHAEDMQYWRKQLAGELPILDLPADYPRPSVQNFSGLQVIADIPPELIKRLHELSLDQNATLFMVMFAAFNIFLRLYSGQEDLLVGTPTGGRVRSDFEGIVGFFVNNLVLRTSLAGDTSVADLIQQIQRTALEAFEHQSISFDQLVEELHTERNLDRSPIFQVLFALQNAPSPLLRLGDIRMTPLDFESFRARYDLSVDIYNIEGNYRCAFEFNTDIFAEATVRQMQQHYLRLLDAVCSDPERRISELSLLNEAEHRQIMEEWNRTEMPVPPYPSVPAWFRAQAAMLPQAPALVMGDRILSYAELDARSSRLAGVLRNHGVERETVVGLYLQRNPEMVVALLAILKAGGAYLPLDPALPAQRIEFLLSDSEVAMILTHSELRGTLPAPSVPLLMIDEVDIASESADVELLLADPGPEDLAYLIYTSGSTGIPKGTEITQGALVNLLASMLNEPGLSNEDILVAVTTLSFDIAGLEIFGPLLSGAKLVLASREQVIDPGSLASLLEESGATVMQATPSTWGMLVESGWMGKANLRMWCGGEALSPDLAEKLLERGRELWNLYGPTETTIWSAAHRIKSGENPVLIGRPIGNTRMYILNSDGHPVPAGVAGELYIAGDGVARGYWKRPELTKDRFVPDPFDSRPGRRMYRTGDLARHRREGQIQLIGRTDHQVKLRGHRIELGEIETVIERHPEVRQAVALVHGEGAGRQLVAYIRQSEGDTVPEDLRTWLRERLPDYMVPSDFFPLAEIPLTPNGKVDRKRLMQPAVPPRKTSPSAVNPRNHVEERLAKIWSEILGIDRVSVRDNFFDLGGHSLLLIRVHARVKKELDADVAVVDLFRYPTIESMASWLARRRSELTVAAGASF